jgi:hypothetical protein
MRSTRSPSAPLSLPRLSLVSVACVVSVACAEPAPSETLAPPEPAAAAPVEEHVAPAAISLPAALQARGFAVQSGAFEFLDLSSCCATTCSGNNPSSPYASFFLPPAPGQTASNPKPRPDGLAASYRLRADEAIVYLGVMPPEAAYYGFTPYLMERSDAQGTPRSIFASLSETLNQRVIATEGTSPFEQRAALIVAADATTTALARQALVASGVRDTAINVITLDPAVGRFGLSATSDAFGVLFRLALVTDEAKRAAYLANPGGTVLRITPTAPRPLAPLPSPQPRTKATSPTETALRPAVNRLGGAIAAAYPGYLASNVSVDDGVPDPASCIANLTFCAGDNRDTSYPGTAPRVLFSSDDDFYVVYGVNHELTGKTSYSNASVYALEKLVGLVSVASDQYPGSAATYLPGDPAAPVLYAWKLARRCGPFEPFCLEVPKGGCPTGMPNGALGTITFRTYLEPSSKTAPLPSTLVGDRIWAFRKR